MERVFKSIVAALTAKDYVMALVIIVLSVWLLTRSDNKDNTERFDRELAVLREELKKKDEELRLKEVENAKDRLRFQSREDSINRVQSKFKDDYLKRLEGIQDKSTQQQAEVEKEKKQAKVLTNQFKSTLKNSNREINKIEEVIKP